MILERFATDHNPVLDDDFRLRFRQAIAFEGVARIRQTDLEIAAQRCNMLRPERPELIEFRFQSIDALPVRGLHSQAISSCLTLCEIHSALTFTTV